MTATFDPDTGRATLDRVSFDALLALAAGADPPARGLEKAQEAGLVSGSSLHPAVRTPIAAAADPVAVARLEMRNEEGKLVVGECWVSTEAATYLVGQPGGDLELISTAPSFFPVSISRLVGLSPRPRTGFQPWRMPREMVDDTLCDDPERRLTATTAISGSAGDEATTAYADALAKGPWWYWNLGVHWPGTDESDGARSLHIVDTQLGMAILSLSDELIAVDPTNPTEVFWLLTAILPRDNELAFAPAMPS
ncbi:hypothetical protein [Solicola gregarius]|uniref:Uncharacterized protein n=1 Tax=Solicola gregarius TaxID=2908642 RepID=A0AA46YMH3_9ACTN|nr:hypothetical protein [Solicola gregarius]UYM07767.1 hypothetical protein L0C25_12070 [Solicola gregarius]